MPEFVFDSKLPRPADPGQPAPVVTGGARFESLTSTTMELDLVLGRIFTDEAPLKPDSTSHYLRNTNPDRWPIRTAGPVVIDAGRRACFYDVDGDGRLDAVGLTRDPDAETTYRADTITWRKNSGGDPLRFGPPQKFPGQHLHHSTFVAAVDTPQRRGLLFNDKRTNSVSLLEQPKPGMTRFSRQLIASRSADLVAGDQASPFPCDWDGDGDWDLLVGGGNGWPQIIINDDANKRPMFDRPRQILTEGQPSESS